MRPLVSLILFFGIVIVLISVSRTLSGFKGGFGAGVGGSGAAYQEIGFQDLNEAPLIYTSKREAFRGGGGEAIGGRTAGPSNLGDLEEFRGGGGEAIGGRTAGPSNLGDLGSSAEFFSTQDETKKKQVKEAFENVGPAGEVQGTSETEYIDGPANASLLQPRKPYNLLEQLPAAPRGSISCLKASCCAESDFEMRTNQTGNFLQRTNNYKREFPDNCTGPLHEFTLAFYKPTPLSKV